MKRNVLPFGIIAFLGVFVAIIVFYIGLSQRDDLLAEESGEDAAEEVVADPETIYANSCVSCHGDDLTGTSGPDISAVGGSLSEDEINDIILNGVGTMPGGLVSGEEAQILAEWLSEMD